MESSFHGYFASAKLMVSRAALNATELIALYP